MLRKFRHLAIGLAMGATFNVATAGAETPSPTTQFFSTDAPDPARWYHVVEFEPGPMRDITRRVYERIELSDARRTNARYLDTVATYGPGHWTYEWEQEAEAFLDRAKNAEKAGNGSAAQSYYLTAAKLFTLGSAPHLRTDDHAMAALAKAREAYQAGRQHMAGEFRVLQIPYAGKTFEAYLHLPPGKGPFPVVVGSNGSDVVKEQAGEILRQELAMRGIALLSIDMPGLGGSGRYDLTPSSDVLHVAAIAYIRRDPDIDPARVAGLGVSFGGNAAARLFLRPNLELRGIVEACGPLSSAFNLPPEAYDQLPAFTIDGVRDRIGLAPDAPATDMAAIMQGFALPPVAESPSGIDTPLLILTTDEDPVAPLDDLSLLVERGEDVDVIISREPGHCPSEFVIASTAAAWLGQQLSARP